MQTVTRYILLAFPMALWFTGHFLQMLAYDLMDVVEDIYNPEGD